MLKAALAMYDYEELAVVLNDKVVKETEESKLKKMPLPLQTREPVEKENFVDYEDEEEEWNDDYYDSKNLGKY